MIPLLRAKLHNGLYTINNYPQAFIGERVSSEVWHARLGHPSINFYYSFGNKLQ